MVEEQHPAKASPESENSAPVVPLPLVASAFLLFVVAGLVFWRATRGGGLAGAGLPAALMAMCGIGMLAGSRVAFGLTLFLGLPAAIMEGLYGQYVTCALIVLACIGAMLSWRYFNEMEGKP